MGRCRSFASGVRTTFLAAASRSWRLLAIVVSGSYGTHPSKIAKGGAASVWNHKGWANQPICENSAAVVPSARSGDKVTTSTIEDFSKGRRCYRQRRVPC